MTLKKHGTLKHERIHKNFSLIASPHFIKNTIFKEHFRNVVFAGLPSSIMNWRKCSFQESRSTLGDFQYSAEFHNVLNRG